jgi:putative transposase
VTTARRKLINEQATPYYSITTNCVRRTFLTGFDKSTGKNYEHRRQWIEDKMFTLVDIFAIDICSYTIMSNHYHLVLHIDKKTAVSWTFKQIFERWQQLHSLDALAVRYMAGEHFDDVLQLELARIAADYRERLMSISWFMRELNLDIAKRANKEDKCKGKFWEARFHSQALLDEAALLACMAYVDLNPVRAKMCRTPEESDYTSIQTRIRQILHNECKDKKLMPFKTSANSEGNVLMFDEKDYLELVDWTGRIIREDKRGAIAADMPGILTRLGMEQKEWFIRARYFQIRFKSVAGAWDLMQQAAKVFKQHWFQGKPSKDIAS